MGERRFGLDFGTTNTALAVVEGGRATLVETTDATGLLSPTFRSVLYFDEDTGEPGWPEPIAGPDAIARYLDVGEGRFIQSTKSYLGSRNFQGTQIMGRQVGIEALIGMILRSFREKAEASVGRISGPIMVGRPVRYAHAKNADDDAMAIARMTQALELAGFDDVRFVYEPVAAAHGYETTLDHDELVLIADLGGGTSDFSLAEVGPSRRSRSEPSRLASAGVAVAGDAFDGEIVDATIAPALGKGSLYRDGFGDALQPVPRWIYGRLRRWHHVSFLRAPDVMERLRGLHHRSEEPDKIEALLSVIEDDLGFPMFRAVERAKLAVSAFDRALLTFAAGPHPIEQWFTGDELNTWIDPHLRAIGTCVDELLERENIVPSEVDAVFLTGGSSLLPQVRRMFRRRFGDNKIRSGGELTTVARGLALADR